MIKGEWLTDIWNTARIRHFVEDGEAHTKMLSRRAALCGAVPKRSWTTFQTAGMDKCKTCLGLHGLRKDKA